MTTISNYSPKVTIIVRTQNRPLLLQRAIQSICSQHYKEWQVIVVNDGGNRQEIEKVCLNTAGDNKLKIHFIHNEKSLGRSFAANQGINFSSLPYLAILDDDDTWEPEFLQKTIQFLEDSDPYIYGGVITHVNKIVEHVENNSIKIVKKSPFHPTKPHFSLFELAQGNFIPPCSLIFRNKVIEKIGGIDNTLLFLEDWDFFLRLAQQFEIGLIPLKLANYHFRTNKTKSVENQNSVVADHEKCVYYENYLRNKYLRKDLRDGKIGLGFMMNVGICISQISLWQCIKNDLKRLKKILFRGLSK